MTLIGNFFVSNLIHYGVEYLSNLVSQKINLIIKIFDLLIQISNLNSLENQTIT